MISQMIATELRKLHPSLNISLDENNKALLVDGKGVYLNDIANEGVLEQFHAISEPLQLEVLQKISDKITATPVFMDAKLTYTEQKSVEEAIAPIVEEVVTPMVESTPIVDDVVATTEDNLKVESVSGDPVESAPEVKTKKTAKNT